MVKFSHWRDSQGLACMIDVEFATLGIIRCNIGDSVSVRLHLSVLKEMGNWLTGLGVLWFPAGLFFVLDI